MFFENKQRNMFLLKTQLYIWRQTCCVTEDTYF